MEHLHLILFLLNTLLILADASLAFHMSPQLLAGANDPETTAANIRRTRNLLPVIVLLYMFFNCMGFFQAHTAYLVIVSGMILMDLALQAFLRRRKKTDQL